MNCSTSVITPECLFLHDRSSRIRHSEAGDSPWHQWDVIDQDAIRARLRQRFDHLGLSVTGVWLKRDHGIGQTTIRNFLDGDTKSLTVDTVSRLAEPLKTSEDWILFGNRDQSLSGDVVQQMIDNALEEIQPGMSLAEIRRAAASALHAQIKLHLSDGANQAIGDEASVRDTGAQSPSPTT